MELLSVLCLMFLVSQMESLPVNQRETILSRKESEMDLKDLPEDFSLLRVRREVIGSDMCPSGKVKLEGKCVSCDEYEDRTDKDCPINNQKNGIP